MYVHTINVQWTPHMLMRVMTTSQFTKFFCKAYLHSVTSVRMCICILYTYIFLYYVATYTLFSHFEILLKPFSSYSFQNVAGKNWTINPCCYGGTCMHV